jgi:hypothetical protein
MVTQDESLDYVEGMLFTTAATGNRNIKTLDDGANDLVTIYIIYHLGYFNRCH